jgi:hypothetical protein
MHADCQMHYANAPDSCTLINIVCVVFLGGMTYLMKEHPSEEQHEIGTALFFIRRRLSSARVGVDNDWATCAAT